MIVAEREYNTLDWCVYIAGTELACETAAALAAASIVFQVLRL